MTPTDRLLQEPAVAHSAVARELAVVMTCPTGLTSSGFPYLQPAAWHRLRDWVPMLFGDGMACLQARDAIVAVARSAAADLDVDTLVDLNRAAAVLGQVVRSAAVCAPSDLWVLRAVVGHLAAMGVMAQLARGEVVRADSIAGVDADELAIDLRFLLARGVVVCAEGGGHRLAPHLHARGLCQLPPLQHTSSPSLAWAIACGPDTDPDPDVVAAAIGDAAAALAHLGAPLPPSVRQAGVWSPTAFEVEVGHRLVPLVVGLAAAGRAHVLSHQPSPLMPADLCPAAQDTGRIALSILRAAAVVDDQHVVTDVGRRVLGRGPGPFGIIEAYRTYLDQLPQIWRHGRGSVHVERGANVAASQAANAKSFGEANDALDAFCRETGFSYTVFIEHALGRGEATRQRLERSGQGLSYFGADLEDAAIAAARDEHRQGHLPANMQFVERTDIADSARLVDAIRAAGHDPDGAVMVVGNGFHEIRDQTDDAIAAVFRGYHDAGIVLLFTEESALSVDDLQETAWNTYHAGFRYVHERSGQHLRPAEARATGTLEDHLSTSWAECATRAGYVRVERFCRRGRTIYPYPPPSGHNPSVSATHFLVPQALAARLKLG
jgi:hypothetical protein